MSERDAARAYENLLAAITPGGIEAQEAAGQAQLVKAKQALLPKEGSEEYEKLGIKTLGEFDDLFVNVELPVGWRLQATDHSMWSNLINADGEEVGAIFYKAAFYDRSAFFRLTPRR